MCCDTIFQLGARIRTVAWNAVMTCAGWVDGEHEDDCVKPYRTYMTIGRIEDPHGDAVIGTHTRSFTPNSSPGGRTEIIGTVQHDFHFEIRYAGFPMVQQDEMGGTVYTPSPEQYEMATRHAMSHSQMAWEAVKQAIQRDTLFSSATRIMRPRGVTLGPLLPLEPRGRIAGHQFDVGVVRL